MHILYIDESGDTGQLPAQPGANDQPVFVIGALIVDAAKIGDLTRDFIDLKTRFYPGLVGSATNTLTGYCRKSKGQTCAVMPYVVGITSAVMRSASFPNCY